MARWQRSSSSTIWSSRPTAWSSRRGSIIAYARTRCPTALKRGKPVLIGESCPPAATRGLRQLLGRLESAVNGVVERLAGGAEKLTGVGAGGDDGAAGLGPVGAEHPEVEVAVLDATGQSVLACRPLEVVGEPDDVEGAQHVVRGVDLPPVEPLARRGRPVVMVVVPALAAGVEGYHHRVSARVGGGVSAPAHYMGQRIDGEGRVPQQHG